MQTNRGRDERGHRASGEPPSTRRALGIRLRELSVRRAAFSASMCVALWCVLYAPGLLPSDLAALHGLWIVILVGVVLAIVGIDRYLPWIILVAAACITVVASTPLATALARWWIHEDAMPAAGVEAIVPLGSTVNNQGAVSAEGVDHLLTALELVKSGKTKLLVTTTVEQEFPTGVVTTIADQTRLIELFSGSVEWIRTPIVHTTRDEAVAVARLLESRGIRRIAVVASPMHTRRACAAFDAVGFQVTCVVSRTGVAGGRNPPDAPRDRLQAFGDWAYEAVAMLEYRVRGWVGARP